MLTGIPAYVKSITLGSNQMEANWVNLRGGAGFAWSGVSNFGAFVGDNGFATMVGLGWEFPVSRTFFITPGVDWYQQWYGGGLQPTYTERIINISLSIGLQGG